MTDYTPATGHVRARYVRDDANFLTDWAEFDRWLAEVKKQERERIRANILDRVQDLSTCHKNDNCKEFGAYIESYIEEWLDGEANE